MNNYPKFDKKRFDKYDLVKLQFLRIRIKPWNRRRNVINIIDMRQIKYTLSSRKKCSLKWSNEKKKFWNPENKLF